MPVNKLSDILGKYKPEKVEGKRPINTTYEEAKEFGTYVGLNPIFVLKLFKQYGKDRVLNLRSWLKDVPYDPKKGGLAALTIWKLKQMQPKAVTNVTAVVKPQ